MRTQDIRKQLMNMKMHLDEMDLWTRQAMNMIHQIEDNLFDVDDKKYEMNDSIEFLKEAASGIYHLIDSPPRLSSRCSKHHNAADGFYQYEEKII